MQQVPEYDLENPSTWTVIPAPPVDPSFLRGLVEIGGLNPFNQPVLVLRWGVTYRDPQSEDGGLKYHQFETEPTLCGFEFKCPETGEQKRVTRLEEVPASVLVPVPKYESLQLGERRFIVERWRSAEFLVKTGRYRHLSDDGDTSTYFECRNCGGHVPVAPETVGLDIERVCPRCSSKRVSPVDLREEGEGQLLRPVPPDGCYDYFYRIERKDGTYHPPDGEALEGIRLLWNEQQKPFGEKTAALNAAREKQTIEARKRRRQIWHPDNFLRKQKEEEIYL